MCLTILEKSLQPNFKLLHLRLSSPMLLMWNVVMLT